MLRYHLTHIAVFVYSQYLIRSGKQREAEAAYKKAIESLVLEVWTWRLQEGLKVSSAFVSESKQDGKEQSLGATSE